MPGPVCVGRDCSRIAVQTLRTEPETFVAIVGILVLAIVLDLVWTRLRTRRAARRD